VGTTLNSIHIFGNSIAGDCGFTFQAFSAYWLTCIDDLSEKDADYSYNAARLISKQTDAPVLNFGVFDSEMIWFEFFCNGKIVSRYSDNELITNKKLYDIPKMVGYEDGNKKRLSTILACSDVDLKIALLEEFFGVCLLYFPKESQEAEMLCRERSDVLYQKYEKEEKALTGKNAPIKLDLIAEYPGKLFYDAFGCRETVKPHYFLHGYMSEKVLEKYHALTPVQFTGKSLEVSDYETFEQGRIPRHYEDTRFKIQYKTPCKVTFSAECPSAFREKTMTLPNGFYPVEFLPSGELLLQGNHRIFVADETFKIIAKLSVKGDVADVIDNYILTTVGDSFCGYCYDSKAKIYLYEVVKNR